MEIIAPCTFYEAGEAVDTNVLTARHGPSQSDPQLDKGQLTARSSLTCISALATTFTCNICSPCKRPGPLRISLIIRCQCTQCELSLEYWVAPPGTWARDYTYLLSLMTNPLVILLSPPTVTNQKFKLGVKNEASSKFGSCDIEKSRHFVFVFSFSRTLFVIYREQNQSCLSNRPHKNNSVSV